MSRSVHRRACSMSSAAPVSMTIRHSRLMPGSAADLREADHRHGVVLGHLAVVELPEEAGHLLDAADLRVVVLDLARREVAELLHLDLVDHRVEDLLARAEPGAREHLDDHPLPVLRGLVAEPDGGRFPA